MNAVVIIVSVSVVSAFGFVACGDDSGGSACLAELDLECNPRWSPPTFDAIYEGRIKDTCASGGVACHGASGNMGGLTLEGADTAYDALLGIGEDHARVIPGDPECSVLMQRLESTNGSFVMPPGQPLTEGERCAIRRWIANGAPR